MSYQGGQTFQAVKQGQDTEIVWQQRQMMLEQFEDMANLLDMPMFRLDPSNLNAGTLNQIMQQVQNLKSQMQDS